MSSNQLTRRAALRWLGISGVGVVLTACSSPAPTATPAPAKPAAPAAPAPTSAPAAKPAATSAPAKPAAPAPTAAPAAAKPAPTTAPAAAAPAKPTPISVQRSVGQGAEITVWTFNDATHIKAFGPIMDDIGTKNIGVKVNWEAVGFDKYAPSFAAKRIADVISVHSVHRQFIMGGVFAPLDTYFKEAGVNAKETFFPGAIEPWEVEGKYVGIPVEDNAWGQNIMVNAGLAQEAGLKIPEKYESWEQIYEHAAKLMHKEGANVTRWGYSTQGTPDVYLFSAIEEQGASFFDGNSQKFTLNTDAGRNAIQKVFYDPVHTHKVETEATGHSYQAMLQQKIGMAHTSFALIGHAEAEKSPVKLESPLRPTYFGNQVKIRGQGGWGFNLTQLSQKKDDAGKFVKYMITPEPQMLWAKAVLFTPAMKTLADDPFWNDKPFLKRVLTYSPNTRFLGGELGDISGNRGKLAAITSDLRSGKISVKDAAERAEKELQANLENFKKTVLQG